MNRCVFVSKGYVFGVVCSHLVYVCWYSHTLNKASIRVFDEQDTLLHEWLVPCGGRITLLNPGMLLIASRGVLHGLRTRDGSLARSWPICANATDIAASSTTVFVLDGQIQCLRAYLLDREHLCETFSIKHDDDLIARSVTVCGDAEVAVSWSADLCAQVWIYSAIDGVALRQIASTDLGHVEPEPVLAKSFIEPVLSHYKITRADDGRLAALCPFYVAVLDPDGQQRRREAYGQLGVKAPLFIACGNLNNLRTPALSLRIWEEFCL